MTDASALTPEQRLALLRRTLKWAEEKTEFYRAAFARAGVRPASVTSFADMARLPLCADTAKEGADAPFFMLTLPLSALLRMSVLRDAAGDAGHIRCYTQGDVARQVQAAISMLTACGVNRACTVLLAGDFTDSRTLDLQYALEAVGALTLPLDVRAGAETAARLLHAAVPDTVIVWEAVVPLLSALLRGSDIGAHRLISMGPRLAPTGETLRLAAQLGARQAHLFAPAALGALVGHSCAAGTGIHLEERLFFAEAVDAAGCSNAEDGAVGELVLSTLAAEAMPMLRCRTGLRVRLHRGACGCGSTALRLTEE